MESRQAPGCVATRPPSAAPEASGCDELEALGLRSRAEHLEGEDQKLYRERYDDRDHEAREREPRAGRCAPGRFGFELFFEQLGLIPNCRCPLALSVDEIVRDNRETLHERAGESNSVRTRCHHEHGSTLSTCRRRVRDHQVDAAVGTSLMRDDG